MAVGFVTTLRNARLDAITSAIGASGKLRIYSGTRPATGGSETTMLAELALSATAAAAASGGVLTFNTISTGLAVAAGTATWARVVTSGGSPVLDMSCGLSGSGAEVIMEATTLAVDDSVSCSSASLTEGNA